jgi:hypothetical protein
MGQGVHITPGKCFTCYIDV